MQYSARNLLHLISQQQSNMTKFVKTYRDDLSTDPNGLMSGICEIISIDGNSFAMPFISPSSIISESQNKDVCKSSSHTIKCH